MTAKILMATNVRQSEYKSHLKKATDFYQGMKLSEGKGLWHSTGLNAVHCAISLSDALTIYYLSKRFSGDDHKQAPELLSRIPVDGIEQKANSFKKIILKKHMIAYEEREFRKSEAAEISQQTERLDVPIKANERNYFVEIYVNRIRKRKKIGPSRVLAETVEKKWLVEKAEGRFLDKKKQLNIKFEVFAEEYLQLHAKVNNKAWKTDEFGINTLKKYFTGKCLHEITPHMVDVFKRELAKTLKPATVNRRLCTFKTMFNKASSWEKFSGPNPVQAVKFFKLNNTRLRFLEKDEIVKLLAHCPDHLKGIVIVALNTGMRKAEILGLKWRDVDIKRNILYLRETKNGEKREVPINEQVKTVLINTLRNPQSEYVFNYNDKRIIDIKRSYSTAVDNSGIKDFTFHDLRHTFASHLVMNGVDLNTVRELLGHKSLQMTLRYAHLSAVHKHKAVEGLSKRMDTIWTKL